MVTYTTITVPTGMSCVNAFRALWENSKSTAGFSMDRFLDIPAIDAVSTAEKVASLFRHHTNFNYEGERFLNINFSQFPELEVGLYDKEFGPGAAEKALGEYNEIPPSKRFDKNDFYRFEQLTSEKEF
ncbi:MAG: hypothetical protein ACRCSV_00780 [Chlamydiales bacterium]